VPTVTHAQRVIFCRRERVSSALFGHFRWFGRTVTGNVEFRFTAVGTPQATIQISTNLLNWQSHQTVPLVAGHGLFTESANAPARFYRLSVP